MMRRWMPERAAAAPCSPRINTDCAEFAGLPADGRLRLLSFNIQVGINTERYRHYVTRSWQHLLPHAGRTLNLQRIAGLLADFDLVALQEVDGGSLRSGFVNQVERLAQLEISRSGISSSTAITGGLPSTATVCSAVCNRPCLRIILYRALRAAAPSCCVWAKVITRWW